MAENDIEVLRDKAANILQEELDQEKERIEREVLKKETFLDDLQSD